jgi:hypothetical protein
MLERVRQLLAEPSGDLTASDRELELPSETPDLTRELRDVHEADHALERAFGRDMPRQSVAPRKVIAIKGMGGRVYDFRGTGLCPPVMSAGRALRITPVIFVHHIPVIRNAPGIGDFITLGNVLRAQKLNVHSGTDSEGNVALFTGMNQLCYHARGANSLSVGAEHMHLTIGEPWGEPQMRAAAYLSWRALHYYGIPLQGAVLGAAAGFVTIHKRGHTSHRIEAIKAGFNDRSDPGPGFHRAHVYELARFYDKHHRF